MWHPWKPGGKANCIKVTSFTILLGWIKTAEYYPASELLFLSGRWLLCFRSMDSHCCSVAYASVQNFLKNLWYLDSRRLSRGTYYFHFITAKAIFIKLWQARACYLNRFFFKCNTSSPAPVYIFIGANMKEMLFKTRTYMNVAILNHVIILEQRDLNFFHLFSFT